MKNEEIVYNIQRLPEEERPRERMIRHGAETMSSPELIALILGSGTKGVSVLQLAQNLLMHFGGLQQLADATLTELCAIHGMGLAKAIQLKAAFNLGFRLSKQTVSPKYRIEHPLHAYNLIKDELEMQKQEHFLVILLDAKGYVITHQIVSIGTLTNTLIHPREVFHPAIRHQAASLILAHNHPSGDPTPSKQDYEVTNLLIQAGKLIGITVNDHIIVGQQSFISLRQQGFAF